METTLLISRASRASQIRSLNQRIESKQRLIDRELIEFARLIRERAALLTESEHAFAASADAPSDRLIFARLIRERAALLTESEHAFAASARRGS